MKNDLITDGICPIWQTPTYMSRASVHTGTPGMIRVDSPRAGGYYDIHENAILWNWKHKQDDFTLRQKMKLTSWMVDQRLFGVGFPAISAEIIEQATLRRPLPVHERADRLLKYIEEKSPLIGSKVIYEFEGPAARIYTSMKPEFSEPYSIRANILAWSESTSDQEIVFLLDYLFKQKWIHDLGNSIGHYGVILTGDGYARLAELATKQINSSQGFVAMWFDGSMNEAYENGIGPGIEDAGYKPLRIDKKEHNNKIDDEIIAEIRRSRFLVADFTHGDTGPRGGVYYEAGFAHGLNIPVFFTCRKDCEAQLHFDTRQYNHILWEKDKPEELRKQLADRISAVIGDGPNKLPKA